MFPGDTRRWRTRVLRVAFNDPSWPHQNSLSCSIRTKVCFQRTTPQKPSQTDEPTKQVKPMNLPNKSNWWIPSKSNWWTYQPSPTDEYQASQTKEPTKQVKLMTLPTNQINEPNHCSWIGKTWFYIKYTCTQISGEGVCITAKKDGVNRRYKLYACCPCNLSQISPGNNNVKDMRASEVKSWLLSLQSFYSNKHIR